MRKKLHELSSAVYKEADQETATKLYSVHTDKGNCNKSLQFACRDRNDCK